MKKIALILLAAFTVVMLSSCIIVTEDKSDPTYSITFCNDSNDDVCDWYVKNDDGKKYAITDEFCIVTIGSTSRLRDLKEDYYQVLYAFLPGSYYESDFVELDDDIEFRLVARTSYDFRYRSAVSSAVTSDDSEIEYCLLGSNGKEYPLHPCSK